MTDREILELAAKAAGVPIRDLDNRYDRWEADPILIHRAWNPLEDDGDCARLEAELRLTALWMDYCVMVEVPGEFLIAEDYDLEATTDQRQAARRFAVARAAAEIGKGMK